MLHKLIFSQFHIEPEIRFLIYNVVNGDISHIDHTFVQSVGSCTFTPTTARLLGDSTSQHHIQL